MADDYDKTRNLTEQAMDAIVEGDQAKADRLAKKAKATNTKAVKDVNDELAEDASSEHDPKKLDQELGKRH